MKEREELIQKLKDTFGTQGVLMLATVTEVNEADLSCTVETLNEVEVFDVRLKASISNNKDGMVQIPTIGSTVLVAMIGKEQSELFIAAFTQVDKVMFYGGDNGGLINIETLKAELDKTNEVVTALVDSLTGWTPVPNDGGAALKTYASGQLSGKQVGDYSNMEDVKVLH